MSEGRKLAQRCRSGLGRQAIIILLALSALILARSIRIQRTPHSSTFTSVQVIHQDHGQSFDDDTGLLWAIVPQSSGPVPPVPEYRPVRPQVASITHFVVKGPHYNRPPPVFS